MRYRFVLTLLLTFPLFGTPAPIHANESGISALIATPYEGHSSDAIYVSGAGFPPNSRETISMACPDWANNPDGNLQTFVGPITDKNGNFKAFQISAVKLYHLTGSPCKIYANVNANDFGVTIPGIYTIVAPNDAIDRCARIICGRLKLDPIKVRPGQVAHINLQTGGHGLGQVWPGADAEVTVTMGRARITTMRVPLNSHGQAKFKVRFSAAAGSSSTAMVHAVVHLGEYTGSMSAKFSLIRRNVIPPAP